MSSGVGVVDRGGSLFAAALVAGMLAAPGCSQDEPWTAPPGLYQSVGGIIGGTPTSGWPAIGAYLIDGGYGGMCTATLVAPDVLLTAAHCVAYSGSDDMFYVGDNINNATWNDLWDIDQAIAHPNYNWHASPYHDVAVLILNQPLFGVDPIPANTTPFEQSWVGDWFHYVGFGVNDYYNGNNAGIKRETDIQLYEYFGWEYVHYTEGTNTCSGDSGGPSLVDIGGDWYVAGINSFVQAIEYNQDPCHGIGVEMRVDADLDFFDDYFDPYADDDTGDDDAGDDDTGDDDAGDDDAGDDDAGDDDAGDDDEWSGTPADEDDVSLVGPEDTCQCSVEGPVVGSTPLAAAALLLVALLRRR